MKSEHEIVIVGGGTAGITVAAGLTNQLNDPEVLVVEPREEHYYQPLWTLNGAGISDKTATVRPQREVIPAGVDWLQEAVSEVDPDENEIETETGKRVGYDHLVLAPGIQLNWEVIPGLEGNVGSYGICSNYSYETVDTTRETIESFEGGTALFTMPETPVKCPGAPQKIAYLADEVFRRNNVRSDTEIILSWPSDRIFGIDKYAKPLEDVVERKNIDVRFRTCLRKIEPEENSAILEDLDSGDRFSVEFDMAHVTPPQGGPDFLEGSGLTDDEGWIEVDKHTLRNPTYRNVFSLGDASNLPTSKTGAAVRKQAPVLVQNLMDVRSNESPSGTYHGYTACPLVTGFGSVILAEFDYDGNPRETFPVDQGKERRTMYWVKRYLLPQFYWHGMLKGRV